jgi:hypothetical protein
MSSAPGDGCLEDAPSLVPSENSFTRFSNQLPQKNAYAWIILRCFVGVSETTSTKRRYALVRVSLL